LCYSNTIWWDEEEQAWFAKIPLLGFMTHAEKKENIAAMIEDAKHGWLEASLPHGHVITELERTRD